MTHPTSVIGHERVKSVLTRGMLAKRSMPAWIFGGSEIAAVDAGDKVVEVVEPDKVDAADRVEDKVDEEDQVDDNADKEDQVDEEEER